MKDYRLLLDNLIHDTSVRASYLFGEPLSKHSTFRIGGEAGVFIQPEDSISFVRVLAALRSASVRFFVAGGGSNVVFSDDGFDGAVVSTASLCAIRSIPLGGNDVLVTCEAGASMAALVSFCAERGFCGVEEFAGLPGTVGGALFMNARCFEKQVSDIFESANYLDSDDFATYELNNISSEWDYKVSPFQNSSKIILSARFKLSSGASKQAIQSQCKKYIEERKVRGHFSYPSAGSVFRNNHDFGAPSGKLIDDCGLKGTKIGGAQIAPFHGNFIINIGGATQKDVKALVELTVNKVKERTGFVLQPEIIFVD